jgi:hypothetical protein
MGILDYLKAWDLPAQEGDSRKNASGADSDAPDYDGGVPARWPMPENTDYGYGKDGNSGGYGHSEDCRDAGQKASAWGMSGSDIERGFESPKSDGEGPLLGPRQPGGSFEQSIPSSNPHNRGSGSDVRAREFADTEGRGFAGEGNDKPSPGREAMGSTRLPS